MLTLGIDTATAVGSLAVARDGRVLGTETISSDAEHSAALSPALERLLERCEVSLKELDGIGVGLGPGSYTGLRVGIAFAKGLEFGLEVPLVGVPSLEAMAYTCGDFDDRHPGGTICALVDAKMGGIYAGLYRASGDEVAVVREPWVSRAEAFAVAVEGPLLFVGPDEAVIGKLGAAFENAEFREAHPDAAYAALRAACLLGRGKRTERFATIHPYYLRPSFAELTKQQRQEE